MSEEGIVRAVCISEKKGTAKTPVDEIRLIKDYGIENDAHAGKWHRQVSLLSYDRVMEFNEKGAGVNAGDFGENILVEGIDLKKIPVGSVIKAGTATLMVTQIGKECHSHCEIHKRMGDCIMPREGIFAVVHKEGIIKKSDMVQITAPSGDRPYTAAVITMSDTCFEGVKTDESGPVAKKILEDSGYEVVEYVVLPDEDKQLKALLIRLCDSRQVDLVVTTGGTGFSDRDITPEATLSVAHKTAPGISEYMRMRSMELTPRAMLGRGVSVIRKRTLIINLPGSKKAVEENLDFIKEHIKHGLDVLRGSVTDCGRRK